MKILSLLFIVIVVFAQDPLQAKSKSQHSNTTNVLISGWKPSKNFNNENKANFKTVEALKKFKRIGRLKLYFKEAAGFAVFPNIAKAGLGLGGARGSGEVFEDGKVIGSTTVTQLSFGFQLGGQAFSQIIFFQNKRDIDRFTDGNFEFGASASAALITEGANASVDYTNGVAVMTFSKGGLMYEASIGGQKFTFKGY